MKQIPPVDTRTLHKKLQDLLYNNEMLYGTKRRAALLTLLREREATTGYGLIVNRIHCPIVKKDPDLQYMIKHKMLLMKRGTPASSRCIYQQLWVNDDKI